LALTDTIVLNVNSKPNFLDKQRLTTDSFYQRSWSITYSSASEIFGVFVFVFSTLPDFKDAF